VTDADAEIRARLVAVEELLEDGDVPSARAAISAWLAHLGRGVTCHECGSRFDWPGLRDDHEFRVHGRVRDAA
jgi:hypothetical protein